MTKLSVQLKWHFAQEVYGRLRNVQNELMETVFLLSNIYH